MFNISSSGHVRVNKIAIALNICYTEPANFPRKIPTFSIGKFLNRKSGFAEWDIGIDLISTSFFHSGNNWVSVMGSIYVQSWCLISGYALPQFTIPSRIDKGLTDMKTHRLKAWFYILAKLPACPHQPVPTLDYHTFKLENVACLVQAQSSKRQGCYVGMLNHHFTDWFT